MTELAGKGAVKRIQLEAVVIRADGTREELGVISDSNWRGLDPRRLLAAFRTRRANARIQE